MMSELKQHPLTEKLKPLKERANNSLTAQKQGLKTTLKKLLQAALFPKLKILRPTWLKKSKQGS